MESKSESKLILNGDIGGTNSRLQLWKINGSDHELVNDQRYESSQFKSLEECVKRFLIDSGINLEEEVVQTIDGCCIAICGPVENEKRMFGPVLPE